jgi:pyruvate/2-oxoglutarate dehydrogenase complex dihydrolipoamide dehydrogenase (E3) component
MGSVYNRLGAEVEVIEFADRILANFDHEISSLFQKILKKHGMKFNLSHKVVGGSQNANGTVNVVIEDVKVCYIFIRNLVQKVKLLLTLFSLQLVEEHSLKDSD